MCLQEALKVFTVVKVTPCRRKLTKQDPTTHESQSPRPFVCFILSKLETTWQIHKKAQMQHNWKEKCSKTKAIDPNYMQTCTVAWDINDIGRFYHFAPLWLCIQLVNWPHLVIHTALMKGAAINTFKIL